MSASLPAVSVIIPTYNRSRLLIRAVQSALAQASVEQTEVIVIDDGSTDDTEAALVPYADRIIYLKQSNQGVVAARNHGIKVARGEFIAFLDSDDTWAPWKLAAQLYCFRLRPAMNLLWTNAIAVDDEGNVQYEDFVHTFYAYRFYTDEMLFSENIKIDINDSGPSILRGAHFGVGDLSSSMFMGNLVVTSTVLIRKAVLEASGQFDPAMGQAMEDYDLFWRICEHGPVGFLNVPSTYMRRGANDHLIAAHGQMAMSDLNAIKKYYRRHPEGPKLDRAMIAYRMMEVYERVGLAKFIEGDRATVRKHALMAILHGTRRKRIYLYFLMSLFPPQMTKLSRWLWQRARALRASALSARRG